MAPALALGTEGRGGECGVRWLPQGSVYFLKDTSWRNAAWFQDGEVLSGLLPPTASGSSDSFMLEWCWRWRVGEGNRVQL